MSGFPPSVFAGQASRIRWRDRLGPMNAVAYADGNSGRVFMGRDYLEASGKRDAYERDRKRRGLP